MNETIDTQPGSGLNLDNFVLMRGYFVIEGNDLVVTKEDMDDIYFNVNANNKTYLRLSAHHSSVTPLMSETESPVAKSLIKRKLNKEELTDMQRCINQIDPEDKPWWCII